MSHANFHHGTVRQAVENAGAGRMAKWTDLTFSFLAEPNWEGTQCYFAKEIGVHRSTVMRHIDTLEESLGVLLFQRNDKGYIPTEAGLDIMQLGEVTDSHFSQLFLRLKHKEQVLEGTLTITCVNEMADLLMPAINRYLSQHAGMHVNIIGDLRHFNLEYGEADIAIRAGEKPTTPDNVVLPLMTTDVTLCAHTSYIQAYGLPDESNIKQHRFLALSERPKSLFWNEWIYENIPAQKIVLTASSPQILSYGLFSGCGIGVFPTTLVNNSDDLVEVTFPRSWQIATWVLVHRDMINMPKIKTFLDILKQQTTYPYDPVGRIF